MTTLLFPSETFAVAGFPFLPQIELRGKTGLDPRLASCIGRRTTSRGPMEGPQIDYRSVAPPNLYPSFHPAAAVPVFSYPS